MEKFRPQIGLKTSDAYLHGCTNNDCIGEIGVIEHVGIDYFILRVGDKPYLIENTSYWTIEENDFK